MRRSISINSCFVFSSLAVCATAEAQVKAREAPHKPTTTDKHSDEHARMEYVPPRIAPVIAGFRAASQGPSSQFPPKDRVAAMLHADNERSRPNLRKPVASIERNRPRIARIRAQQHPPATQFARIRQRRIHQPLPISSRAKP